MSFANLSPYQVDPNAILESREMMENFRIDFIGMDAD